MSRPLQIAGQKFGHLLALAPTEHRKNHQVLWDCLCDCGKHALVGGNALKFGQHRTCGECTKRVIPAWEYKKFKVCVACAVEKSFAEFWNRRDGTDGKFSRCIECLAPINQQRSWATYEDHHIAMCEKVKQNQRRNRERDVITATGRETLNMHEESALMI